MKYQGLIKKSRTLDLSMLAGIIGVVIESLPLVREQLGEYYGFVFIGFSVILWILRHDTKGPVGEK